jgi:hypothetical protein
MNENNEKPKVFTREYFVEQGRRGGQKVKELYGITHFEKMSRKGVKKRLEKNT